MNAKSVEIQVRDISNNVHLSLNFIKVDLSEEQIWRQATCLLLMYDVSNEESFREAT